MPKHKQAEGMHHGMVRNQVPACCKLLSKPTEWTLRRYQLRGTVQAIARLWRIAFFVLRSFLELPADSMAQPTGLANAMSMAPTLAAAATLTTELGLPMATSSHTSSHTPSRLSRQQPSYR